MSEPQPESPARIDDSRFQMRISDFYVLIVFLSIHLAIWADARQPSLILAILGSITSIWLVVLFLAQERLNRTYRPLRLSIYMMVFSFILTLWFGTMKFDYLKKDLHTRRNQRVEIGFVIDLERVWHVRDIAAAKEGMLQPNAHITSLKDLSLLAPEIIDAECSDPLHDAGKVRPFHGYLIKLLKNRAPHAALMDPQVLSPSRPIVIYPANYSEARCYSFLITEEGHWEEKDFGPGTREVISQMETYVPTEWAKQ